MELNPDIWKNIKTLLSQQKWDFTRKITSEDNQSTYEDYKKGEEKLTLHANTFAGIEISVTGTEGRKSLESIVKTLGLAVQIPAGPGNSR